MSPLERPQRASAAQAAPRIHEHTQDYSTRLRESGKGGQIEGNRVRTSHELRIFVRARLFEVIKSAIGRDIVPRNRKPLDPRHDDLEHPNLYKWIFTTKYPRFPTDSIGHWPRALNEACLHAIDQGWLSVLALPYEAADHLPHERVDAGDSSEDQRRPSSTNEVNDEVTNKQYNLDQQVRLVMEQIIAGDDISRLRDSCSKIDDLTDQMEAARREDVARREEAANREEAARREAYEQLITDLKHTLRVRDNIIEFATSKVKLLEEAAKDQSIGNQQLKTCYEELQKEYFQVLERLEHHLDDLDRERQLGEIQDLRTETKDLRAEYQCLRNELKAQSERYEIQLRRERFKAKQEGFQEGKARASSQSRALIADLKEEVTNLQRELEENQANHAKKILRAREEGRREDEVLNHLLEGRNLLYTGRKRREIRTIYNNWRNIPQNILPKPMLPDSITLGDKTLYLLARLSRAEHDPNKATALLQEVVERRNSQLTVARQEPTITNADIKKVLSNLEVTDSSRRSSETGSTPQTESSRYMRNVRDVSPCHNHYGQTGSSTHGVEKVSGATPSSQAENDNSMHLPDSFHEISTTKTNSTLIPALESQRQMITSQIGSTSSINRTIEEEINLLRVPQEHLIPSSLQHFPMEFINKAVRGDNSTFAKCARSMLDKQIVAWPEMIKLNTDIHPLGPSQGSNGALTFVYGRPNTGEIGKTYPILLKEKVGFYKYIGHYQVIKRIIMPVEIWKTYAPEERIGIAEEIEAREWGQNLLTRKGLCTNATDVAEKRIDDILKFFERPLEPCLRISWTLLQFSSFKEDDYNLLLIALEVWEMEQDSEVDAPLAEPEVLPLPCPSQILDQDTGDNIQRVDGLPSSSMLVTESEVGRTNRYTFEANDAAKRHNRSGASDRVRNDSPVVSEIQDSSQVTSASIISIISRSESPDDVAPAEDGRWDFHATRSLQLSPETGSVTEQQFHRAQTPSPLIKRLYEEDIYEVSPPRRVSSNISTTWTSGSIFSQFARTKKRKLSPQTVAVEITHC